MHPRTSLRRRPARPLSGVLASMTAQLKSPDVAAASSTALLRGVLGPYLGRHVRRVTPRGPAWLVEVSSVDAARQLRHLAKEVVERVRASAGGATGPKELVVRVTEAAAAIAPDEPRPRAADAGAEPTSTGPGRLTLEALARVEDATLRERLARVARRPMTALMERRSPPR